MVHVVALVLNMLSELGILLDSFFVVFCSTLYEQDLIDDFLKKKNLKKDTQHQIDPSSLKWTPHVNRS